MVKCYGWYGRDGNGNLARFIGCADNPDWVRQWQYEAIAGGPYYAPGDNGRIISSSNWGSTAISITPLSSQSDIDSWSGGGYVTGSCSSCISSTQSTPNCGEDGQWEIIYDAPQAGEYNETSTVSGKSNDDPYFAADNIPGCSTPISLFSRCDGRILHKSWSCNAGNIVLKSKRFIPSATNGTSSGGSSSTSDPDCCKQLRAELETLKTEIAKLQNINEQSIVDKAVKQATQLLDPRIAAIGITATAAMSGVNGLEIALAKVGTLAANASSKVAALTGTVAGLAARLAPILAALAALGASIGTLHVLGNRIDGVESYVDLVSSDLAKLYGTVGKHDEAIKHIRGTANNALIKADRALGKFPGIESAITDLKAAIKHVQGTANDALIVARRAMAKFPSLEATIEHIRGTANDGLIVARKAESKIDGLKAKFESAVTSLNSRLNEFELGVRFIYEDLDSRLQLAIIYFTESITGMSENIYKTIDIHSREIYRFNQDIAGLKQRIGYIINSYVPTYVKSAIRTLSGAIESLKARVSKLEKVNLNDLISNLTNTINNVISNNPTIKNLTNRVNNVTNVTNTYVTNVVNNATNTTVNNLSNRIGAIENQVKELDKVNEKSNQNLDVLKGLILALPTTLASNQVYQSAAINAAAAGSCKSLSGGCSGSPLPKMQNDVTGANTKLDLLLQTGQGALLTRIDKTTTGIASVLGTKVLPGGLSSAFSRFTTWQGIDRMISLVTMIGVVHNCFMLSTAVTETFFGVLDNVFTIPELIKNSEAEAIDSKKLFTEYYDKFFASLFGASEWTAIKAQWKSYNAIYSSTSQLFGNIRDIIDETQNIQYTTNNWVAQLGNGLTDEGVIGEDNWDYKDPNQRPKGKYFGRLDEIRKGIQTVENVLEDLEQVTGSVRNIVTTANEIKENGEAINKAINEANKKAKEDREAKVEGLELPNFSLDDLF